MPKKLTGFTAQTPKLIAINAAVVTILTTLCPSKFIRTAKLICEVAAKFFYGRRESGNETYVMSDSKDHGVTSQLLVPELTTFRFVDLSGRFDAPADKNAVTRISRFQSAGKVG